MNQSDPPYASPVDAAGDESATGQRPAPADDVGGFQLNLPNALTVFRLVGSAVLIAVAPLGDQRWFLAAFLLLAATDLVDGPLARRLGQRTAVGARMDSVADALMYGALLWGCIWFEGRVLLEELPWIAAALAAYALSCLASLARFRRLPSHHAYSAKLAWAVATVAAVSLLTDWSAIPLRIAAAAVLIANLESTLISLLSDRWQADVPSVWHAWRQARRRPTA